MKLISLTIIVFSLTNISSCNRNSVLDRFTKEFNAKKILLVSCIQCKCINTELEKLYAENKAIFNGYRFLGDTNCLKSYKFKTVVTHLPQRIIDSLFEQNYNLTIINDEKYPNQILSIKAVDAQKIKTKL